MYGYKNIIVAVDDSKEAESALRKSIKIAKLVPNSTLHIANVIDSYAIADEDFSTLEREQQLSEKLLNSYKSIAMDEGITNAEHFFLGSVSEKIVQTATCDVLIIRTD